MRYDPEAGPALLALFEDLEQQAEGLALAERDDEVQGRLSDEYAEVDLLSRLHAAVGHRLVMTLQGAGDVRGVLVRAGADWCLVARDPGGVGAEELVHLPAVVGVRGLPEDAWLPRARPLLSRLRLTACLRRLADEGAPHVLRLVDGSSRSGLIGRVGADFVEVWGEGPPVVVPLAATASVVRR